METPPSTNHKRPPAVPRTTSQGSIDQVGHVASRASGSSKVNNGYGALQDARKQQTASKKQVRGRGTAQEAPSHEVPRSDSPPISGAAGPKGVRVEDFLQKALAQAEQEEMRMITCRHCQRSFNEQAHSKHVKICQKVFQKKRKVYNMTDHRLPDEPEVEQIKRELARNAKKKGNAKEAPLVNKNKWRAKSEQFRNAMKDARMVKQCQKEGKPLPPPQMTAPELDDRTPCPHCGRKFGTEQAARHIPHCAKAKARPNAIGTVRQSAAAPKGYPRKRA